MVGVCYLWCLHQGRQRRLRCCLLWAKLRAFLWTHARLVLVQRRLAAQSSEDHAFRSLVIRRHGRSSFGSLTARPPRLPNEYHFDAPYADKITGFLIDLDGTMYTPDGLIPGALSFYRWLKATGKQYVFLSNTGAKNGKAVQRKFLQPPFKLDDHPIPLTHVFTAAEAQVDFLLDTVPPAAKVLVIASCGEVRACASPVSHPQRILNEPSTRGRTHGSTICARAVARKGESLSTAGRPAHS